MPKHPLTNDPDNPEWTAEDFARAKRGEDIPADIRKAFGRPPMSPHGPKKLVSIRLSPDVLEAFRASGKGWQSRIDEVLRKAAGL